MDIQRLKVYQAEQFVAKILEQAKKTNTYTLKVAGKNLILPREKYFTTLGQITDYVNYQVLNDPQVVYRYGLRDYLKIRKRKGNMAAHFEIKNGEPCLAFPINELTTSWAQRELVILHEVTHYLLMEQTSNHDSWFVKTFGELVQIMLGDEVYFLFKYAFEQNGVATDFT